MGGLSSRGICGTRDASESEDWYGTPFIGAVGKRGHFRFRLPQWLLVALVLGCYSVAHATGIEYTWDNGRLTKATYDDGTVVTYQYDDNGNRISASSTGGPDIKAPTVPTGLVATVRSSVRIDVSWTASTDDRSTGVTGYKIERCTGVGCTNFAQVYTISKSPFQNSGLVANTSYSFRVRAYDAAGNTSDPSSAVTATTLPDTIPPTTPSGTLTATTASSTQINLAWGGATDSGGSGLAGYRVQRCSGVGCANFVQIKQQTARTLSDTGLTASTSYSYRVYAYDKAGNVSASPTNTATASTSADTVVPSAPSNLSAAASSPFKVDLAWTASTDTGGAGLAGYKVERCDGAGCTSFSQIATSTTNSYSDMTVTSNTTYGYRVRAYDNASPTNQSGYSNSASATTASDTTKPSTPTTLTAATQSSASIKLTWSQSTDAGGNLAGYKVERCTGAGCATFAALKTVTGGTTLTTTDTTVLPLNSYSYRVYAYDSVGNISNGYSPTASANTPADTTSPSVPSLTAAVVSSTQLDVSWGASTDTGGAGLAGYKLERCQNADCSTFAEIADIAAPTTSYSDSSLAANTVYQYRALAYDKASPANKSAYSSTASGTTKADTQPPTQPTGLSATARSTDAQVDLTWTASADSGGSGLAGYKIERCSGANCTSFSQINTASSASYTDSGLADGTTYRYQVRAYDGAGLNSSYSSIATVVMPDVSKPTVSGLAFDSRFTTAHSGKAVWAGSDNVGISRYEYSRDGGASWTSNGLTTEVTLTSLSSSATYSLWVRAWDAANNFSSASSASFTTLDDIGPTIPGVRTTSLATNGAVVGWDAAQDNTNGSGVASYTYTLVQNSNGVTIASGSLPVGTTQVSLTSLLDNTGYTFRIYATDAVGNVGGTVTLSFTTLKLPDPPTGLWSGQAADCAWNASWNPVANANYYVFRSRDGRITNTSATSVQYGCPTGQANSYRPDSVYVCTNIGCSAKAYFP